MTMIAPAVPTTTHTKARSSRLLMVRVVGNRNRISRPRPAWSYEAQRASGTRAAQRPEPVKLIVYPGCAAL